MIFRFGTAPCSHRPTKQQRTTAFSHLFLMRRRPLWGLSDAMKFTGLSILPSRWENVGMATKRTKADKAQRQGDYLDQKSERRPEQETSKTKVRKDSGRAA